MGKVKRAKSGEYGGWAIAFDVFGSLTNEADNAKQCFILSACSSKVDSYVANYEY